MCIQSHRPHLACQIISSSIKYQSSSAKLCGAIEEGIYMEQSPASLLVHFAAEAPYAVPGRRYRTRRAVRLSSSADDEKIIVGTTDQKTEVEEGQAAQKTDVKEAVAETATHTFRCPICLSPYVEPTAIKVCGHVFCGPCVAEALEKRRKKECPTCRTKASKRHLFRIYLS